MSPENEGIAACMRLNAKLTKQRDELYEALDTAMRLLREVWRDNPDHPIWKDGPSALAKARGETTERIA